MGDANKYLDFQIDHASSKLNECKNEESRRNAEDFLKHWQQLADMIAKKLWHQVTEKLFTLVARPEMIEGDKLPQLYSEVIADIACK
jgi:hypothetical protein